MKKSIMVIVFLICVLVPISAKAETGFVRDVTDEREIAEIKKNVENLLVDMNQMVPLDEKNLTIDVDKAIKVYVNVELFDQESLTVEELKMKIKGKEFVWLAPIYGENKTYWVTIAKGQEVGEEARQILNQEEIEKLESKVGKWTISEVVESEGKYSYEEALLQVLQANGIQDGKIYMFGGTRGYRELLAVVYQEEEIQFLPVKNVMDQALVIASEEGEEKMIFSLLEMKEVAEEGMLSDDELGGVGSNSSNHFNYKETLMSVFGIMGCIVIAALLRRRRLF